MKSHFKRKTVCKPSLNDINLDDYKEDILNGKKNILGKSSVNLGNVSETSVTVSETSATVSEKSVNVSKMSSNVSKTYKCEYCKKNYYSRQGKWQHLKKCKEKVKDDECKKNMMDLVNRLNEQLEEKNKQLDEQKQQLNEQLNEQQLNLVEQLKAKDKQIEELIKKAGITNNIQQNIKILAYKNTDLSHLTDKDYMYCLNRSNFCVPHLIKKIHFNSKKPENHNVYISNIKNKYIMAYDGKKWVLRDREETIDDLIDKNDFVLEQKLEEWIENGKNYPIIMKKFNRYLEKKEKNQVINKIKEEIKLVLFNNREMIKSI